MGKKIDDRTIRIGEPQKPSGGGGVGGQIESGETE